MSLFSDANKLQKDYGVTKIPEVEKRLLNTRSFVSLNNMTYFKASYKRFWVRHADKKRKTNHVVEGKVGDP